MKFLCVQCDQAMKLKDVVKQEEQGTLSVVYECPSCLQEMAMLTNPHETQLVTSLGVNIGPGNGESQASSETQPKCPFAGMLQGAGMSQGAAASSSSGSSLPWAQEALARLDRIPEFIRPMARKGVEDFARDRGYGQIDITVMDEARQAFGF